MSEKLEQIVAAYLADLRDKRGLGAGTPERSYYPAVATLLDAIGAELRPKVLCLSDLGNIGAGQPDFGLFVTNQVQHGEPRKGQMPERGVIEMKSVREEAWLTAKTEQVSKYWGAYRLVIVTNLRDFLILGEDAGGHAARLETFCLAPTEAAFWEMVRTPKKSAEQIGRAFGEYLRRALTQSVSLREPKDVAWFLASYARDALQRVEHAGSLPALSSIRSSLEEALGMAFEGEKGEHFFRSTLVQTLFYGVFSAWVLWARATPRPSLRFDWRTAVWHLNVPFVTTLFQQLASPAHLQPLRLVEVLDWTAATLNRVDAAVFTARFNDTDAVQFFYEPFLEAFDPDLRKALGVWYTPTEVVTYMVARVDKALREDLGVSEGLASEQVYVLDPCCGTGGFLTAVLKRIDATLAENGLGALRGQMVKKAATTRVFGFELLPAPFVVAHLKVGLVLQSLGGAIGTGERAGIYLTNALTGWEPMTTKPLPFPELEEERKKADKVKQDAPILVIIGNPPYNGFAGVAETNAEERNLSTAYRNTRRVRRPEGQGLNDLYVRFYRMAERRIAEKTGRGIVCFISNYSWLDGLSFTGMREKYLDAFDAIRIDCLNGDKYKTGKLTPDGLPDPSIFSTEHNREGIQVGTAIAALIRREQHSPATTVSFRHLWGTEKRQGLVTTAEADLGYLYETVTPPLELGLPYLRTAASVNYSAWPQLIELLPTAFPGVKTSRDEFLVSIDRDVLEARIRAYFDRTLSHGDLQSLFPSAMSARARFDPAATRAALLKRGPLPQNIVQYAYRPFDIRWVYWEPETKLLDEKREEYWEHVTPGNYAIATQQRPRGEWRPCQVIAQLGCIDLLDRSATVFPMRLREHGSNEADAQRPNLAQSMRELLEGRQLPYETTFRHTVAILHAPSYRAENEGALRLDWPRVPVPTSASVLRRSAELGVRLLSLLEAQTTVAGVTHGRLRPGLRTMGLPYKEGGKPISDGDLLVSAGWGHVQKTRLGSTLVMPGSGLAKQRDYVPSERIAIEEEGASFGLTADQTFRLLGVRTYDAYLNDDMSWTNVPASVWDYDLGGYQVIKKWLSYREAAILGRALTADEVAYVSAMVRRIAALLLLGPALDANYAAVKAVATEWKEGRPVVTDGHSAQEAADPAHT